MVGAENPSELLFCFCWQLTPEEVKEGENIKDSDSITNLK
jgi:hypothetical protein